MVLFWELIKRSEEGHQCAEKEFDLKLFKKAKELRKEFEIEFDHLNPVLTDLGMAKDLYQAGLALFLDLGTYCSHSGRVIEIDEAEVKEALKKAPKYLDLGKGPDLRRLGGNRPGKKSSVLIAGGPCGCPVSEDLFKTTMLSFAKEPAVDILFTGMLKTVGGLAPLTHTPYEMAAARMEARLARAALKDAGREDLCITGLVHPTAEATDFADGPDGLRHSDIHEIDPLNELKMDLETFKRMYYCHENGYTIASMMCPVLGGYAGGAEETAITSVAEGLQCFTLIGGHLFQLATNNINTHSGTDNATLWAGSSALLALKSSLPIIAGNLIWAASGPCTDTLCYEIAAKAIADTVCGADIISSAGGTGGKLTDHYTGMEGRIAGKVSRAASGLSPKKANEIVRELLSLYNQKIMEGVLPKPKSFQECYELKSVKPLKEYEMIWESCCAELEALGLKIQPL